MATIKGYQHLTGKALSHHNCLAGANGSNISEPDRGKDHGTEVKQIANDVTNRQDVVVEAQRLCAVVDTKNTVKHAHIVMSTIMVTMTFKGFSPNTLFF